MDTKDVNRFVEEISLEGLQREVVLMGKLKILDTIGTMLAGIDTKAARIARSFVEAKGGKKEATLFGSDKKIPSSEAAFANTIAATDFDFDDGHWWGIHPAAAVIPGLLAVAEIANSTGKELLEAAVAAYEVVLRASDILNPPPKLFFIHASGTCGAYGTAAGTAKLLQLSQEQINNAIRIAGAHAPIASLWMLETGTMVKESMGWGAKTGVEAALLAQLGFTGPLTIFDDVSMDRSSLETLGTTYEIMNSYFKPYSVSRLIHTPLDIVLDIISEHSLTPDDISKITIEARKWATLLRNPRPTTVEQAVYSMPYAVGAVIVDGEVTPRQLREERLNDPSILEVVDKVELVYNPQLDEGYRERYKAAASIETRNGEKFKVQQPFPKWEPQVPFTEEEIKTKFKRLASEVINEKGAEKAMNVLLEIETLPQVSQLTEFINASILDI